MSNFYSNEVIDLTDSFTLIDHCELADIVIELDETVINSPKLTRKSTTALTTSNKPKKKISSTKQTKSKESKSVGIGECPICWDELGKNALVSTKCGHVYCMDCLMQALKQERKCPKCRRCLKGSSSYHPLYI